MFREDLDILVTVAAIELVLDPEIRDVHVPVEVGQVVFPRPVLDRARVPVRASIAIRAVAIALLEELLMSRRRSRSRTTPRISAPSARRRLSTSR